MRDCWDVENSIAHVLKYGFVIFDTGLLFFSGNSTKKCDFKLDVFCVFELLQRSSVEKRNRRGRELHFGTGDMYFD